MYSAPRLVQSVSRGRVNSPRLHPFGEDTFQYICIYIYMYIYAYMYSAPRLVQSVSRGGVNSS